MTLNALAAEALGPHAAVQVVDVTPERTLARAISADGRFVEVLERDRASATGALSAALRALVGTPA